VTRQQCAERGSAGLLAVWGGCLVLVGTFAVLSWAAAVVTRQRAEAAADSAALASASALVRGQPGCVVAARVAAASGGRLKACAVALDGSVEVTLAMPVPAPWLRALHVGPAWARARAGVPP
jgi:secretion/DNA translocation related TadE-like protein